MIAIRHFFTQSRASAETTCDTLLDSLDRLVISLRRLRLRLCAPEAMLAQLDRLVSLTASPNVRLGVIGSETQNVVGPWHGFSLRDNERVLVETFSAELNLVQPPEIALYSKIFKQFAAVASYGRSARAIITRAIDDLVAEVPHDEA
ncbi:MAG: Scr1 family TA system antitoxin-like transcriptional regulator [Pseudonocardiaceae bacterium]